MCTQWAIKMGGNKLANPLSTLANWTLAKRPATIYESCIYIQLFQKMLSGTTTNVNCRTAIARLKRNVGIEY